MKFNFYILFIAGNVFLVNHPGFAQTGQDNVQVINEAQATAGIASNKAVDVGNKFCPVSKDKVAKNETGTKPVIIEYNGKIYHLCCPMCVKDFKKHPEKYSKIAEDEVKGLNK